MPNTAEISKNLHPWMTSLMSGLAIGLLIGLAFALNACTFASTSSTAPKETLFNPRPDDLRTGIIGGIPLQQSDDLRLTTAGIYDLESGSLCSGSIIGERHILTAAHCVKDNTSLIVFFGESLEEMSPTAVVTRAVIPSTFFSYSKDKSTHRSDLAVVEINQSIPATHRIASLMSPDQTLDEGENVIIVGFGTTSGALLETSGTLRKAEVHIKKRQFGLSEFVTDQSQGAGACFGDSGGPAYRISGGHYQLIGVASRVGNEKTSDPCLGFGIYSNVGFFHDFIRSTLVESAGK